VTDVVLEVVLAGLHALNMSHGISDVVMLADMQSSSDISAAIDWMAFP
jgi:hypothetical protein